MYAVRFVRADELPAGHAWAMARVVEDGSCYLFIKRCEMCARVLEEAWAAYRWLTRPNTGPTPRRRRRLRSVA